MYFPLKLQIFPLDITVSIQLFVDALMDEATTGFLLTDALVDIEDLIVPESVRQGDTINYYSFDKQGCPYYGEVAVDSFTRGLCRIN